MRGRSHAPARVFAPNHLAPLRLNLFMGADARQGGRRFHAYALFLSVCVTIIEPGVSCFETNHPCAFAQVFVRVLVAAVLHDVGEELGVAVLTVSGKRRELNRVDIEGIGFMTWSESAHRSVV